MLFLTRYLLLAFVARLEEQSFHDAAGALPAVLAASLLASKGLALFKSDVAPPCDSRFYDLGSKFTAGIGIADAETRKHKFMAIEDIHTINFMSCHLRRCRSRPLFQLTHNNFLKNTKEVAK